VTHRLVQELKSPPSPADALERIADLPSPLLLESAGGGGEAGRFSFLAADPFATLRAREGRITYQLAGSARSWHGDPFVATRELLAPYALPADPGLPPWQGGAAGYFGYDLAGALERLPPHRADDLLLPDLVLGLYDWVVAWDHREGRAWLISTGIPAAPGEPRRRRAAERAERARGWLARDPSAVTPGRAARRQGVARGDATPALHPVLGHPGVLSTFAHGAYVATVQRVRDYILAGDIFQANLSQRLQAPYAGSPVALYRRLRESSPAPYAAYLDIGDAQLVGASPELFLRLRDGEVETRPIKGTMPRAEDPAEDARRAAALAASEKDRAENVMIVDLLRNDLSRVCTDPSVRVPRLCAVESHGAVHHLVSTVAGTLRPGVDAVELLRAAFPGGSITGAPKIRAMEILAELEPTRRGPYTGAIGYIGFDGAMETNIVIRTLVLRAATAHLQVGGGIVADSDPEREYQETLHKAAGMLSALGEGPWS
jgi:para-aminobenzoate synthetase component I